MKIFTLELAKNQDKDKFIAIQQLFFFSRMPLKLIQNQYNTKLTHSKISSSVLSTTAVIV